MPAKGLGLRAGMYLPATGFVPQYPDRLVADLSAWLYWGGPPAYTEIPYSWLAPPLSWLHETLANTATVTATATGASATRTNTASITAHGQRDAPSVTLDTYVGADPANLAQWTVDYRSSPRMKQPNLYLVDLIQRTDDEQVRILRVRQGMRIVITDAPATWPEGSSSLLVEGVSHSLLPSSRTVTWQTSAIAGSTAGTPGPWLRYGSSMWNSTDVIPF